MSRSGCGRRRMLTFALCLLTSIASAETRLLKGRIELTEDTVIGEVDAKGVRLSDVTIHGGTEIRIAGGHWLKIQARTLTILGEGPVVIDGKGEPGAPGNPQSAEPSPEVNAMACSEQAQLELMHSELARGLPGNPGMPGAQGATVAIVADHVRAPTLLPNGTADVAVFRSLFQVNVEGGDGGAGGEGGPGRLLQCGEDPARQRRGPPGFAGPPGPRGPHGSFSLQGEPEPPPVGVAMTISGGISLGSYEAGYNWALVRYIKSREARSRKVMPLPPLKLVAVTGASAGSINTLLTAISYCQSKAVDRTESPFNNVFYDAWVPVGLHSLLPADASEYQPGDAVLSRKAFTQMEQMLGERVAKADNYVPGKCVLPIGVTVTRREPIEIEGSGLEAPVDRFSVALEVRAGEKGLTFHDLSVRDESPYARPYLHLGPGDEPVGFPIVLKALRASSAFPVAFGMETVPFYREKDPNEPDSHEFWDGGLYDNVPISLLLSFIQKPLHGRPRFPGTVQLFAMDPGRRRLSAMKQSMMKAASGPVRRGLSNLPRIAGNVLSVARKYELQNFIRFALPQLNNCQPGEDAAGGPRGDMTCINDPLVSSRYFPVYGQRFGAFGAFILQAFRQFDFAAGIYDGLYSFASVECQGTGEAKSGNKAKAAACLVQSFHRIYNDLKVVTSSDAAYVVTALLRQELKEQLAMSGEDEKAILSGISLPAGGSALSWLDQTPAHKKYFEVLLTRGQEPSPMAEEQGLAQDLELIDQVMAALRDEGIKSELPPVDQQALDAGGSWYESSLSRALRRSHQIEREEKNTLGGQLTGAALLWMQTQLANTRTGIDLDPSSVPDDRAGAAATLFHLLPYEISGALGKTLQVGWRPTLGIHPAVAFGLPLSLSLDWDDTLRELSGAAHAGASLIGRAPSFFLSAVQLETHVTLSTTAGRPLLGAELSVYLLGSKLRLAAAVNDLSRSPSTLAQSLVVTVGLADVNGLLFHALF